MFGNILSCKVATNQKGESLRYGFVHYEGEESANTAILRVDGKVIAGEKVSVSAFKSRKERGGSSKNVFTNVYVKNIPAEIDDKKLSEMFAKYGEITSCKVSYKDNVHKGFGFVNFKTAGSAQAAVDGLNDFQIGEKNLFVGPAQKKEEREKELRDRFEQMKVERQKKYAGVNLYVKNLSDQIDEARLREEFGKFGAITSAAVMTEQASGKSKGFGFVCFSTPEEATRAVTEMNTKMLDGKPLFVALAQRKEVRRQQLEAQYANRVKGIGGPMGQPHMFPGQPGPAGPPPMGFYPGVHPQRMVYPTQQQMMQRWTGPGQAGAAAMMTPHPGVNYQLMAINQRGGGRGGSRGGRGQGRGKQGGPPNSFKYADNVRNREQRPMQQQQPQQAQVMPAADQIIETPDKGRVLKGTQDLEPGMLTVPGNAGPEPLTIKALAAAPEDTRKQMIGERLFPLIKAQQPVNAGKITGMLLEMDNGELLHLLESSAALKEKVDEALMVLTEFAASAEAQRQ